jgi:hypothetical protein
MTLASGIVAYRYFSECGVYYALLATGGFVCHGVMFRFTATIAVIMGLPLFSFFKWHDVIF